MKINNMNFYQKKQTWKYVLFIVAAIIAVASLLLTNLLVKNLKIATNALKLTEIEQMETWAKAIEHLNNIKHDAPPADHSLAMTINQKNTEIPVIVLDECDGILYDKNILITNDSIMSPDERNKFLLEELKIMQKEGDSIFIDVIGEQQKLYYRNSNKIYRQEDIINKLSYFPYYQIGFIALFTFLAYLIFNAAKRSEQNQVWAGMAKETAHQIGTPLSSLMAWVEILKENDEVKATTKEMEKDLQRLEIITERFSKIGSKPELKKENVSDIIIESISYMEKRFSKNILFKHNISFSKKVLLNKTLFIWVLENICKNAADAMKGKGTISISCKHQEKNIEINISDTGMGIDKNILSSIFLPGITSKNRGWGLGLSLSKRIIEGYHKGKIFVQNSNEEGSTFCILIPK